MDHLSSLLWEHLGTLQEELERVTGERDAFLSWSQYLHNLTLDKRLKMDGQSDGGFGGLMVLLRSLIRPHLDHRMRDLLMGSNIRFIFIRSQMFFRAGHWLEGWYSSPPSDPKFCLSVRT